MKKFLSALITLFAAAALALTGCSSPVTGSNPGHDNNITDEIVTDNGNTDNGNTDNPYFPGGFEDFIKDAIAEGSLAANTVDFTSYSDVITGYETITVTDWGYRGDLVDGQWLNGQKFDGQWIAGGEFVDGQWIQGVKFEHIIVAAGTKSGNKVVKYQGADTYDTYDIKTGDNTIGSFTLTNNGKNGNERTIGMNLTLTDSTVDSAQKLVTIQVDTTTTGSYTFHGVYSVGKDKNGKDLGLIGSSAPEFTILSNEGNVNFTVTIQSWDGTWDYTEVADGEPLFVKDGKVYIIDGQTIMGNDYEYYNDTAIFELNGGGKEMFKSGDTCLTRDDDFYAFSEASLFAFNNGSDRIFKADDGTYYYGGEDVQYIDLGNQILVLNSDSEFHIVAGGNEFSSAIVLDTDKPIYDVILNKNFDLEIAYNDDVVVVGTGKVTFDGEETLTVVYNIDPFFGMLLDGLNNWSMTCNNEAVIDNGAALAYEKGTAMTINTVFAFEVQADDNADAGIAE
ncbi:MAG: hypothetical protein FWD78_10165 [Treponema sp.]|nr:hypothetical protein [Treponema sp.]